MGRSCSPKSVFGRGNALRSTLPFGVNGIRSSHMNARRNQFAGQFLCQSHSQHRSVECLFHFGNEIRNESSLTSSSSCTGNHDTVTHLRQFLDCRLDLRRIDANPPDLDLRISTPQVQQHPTRQHAPHVARAKHPPAVTAWIRHKRGLRQLGPPPIPCEKIRTADSDLACFADGYFLLVVIKQHHFLTFDGEAGGDSVAVDFGVLIQQIINE